MKILEKLDSIPFKQRLVLYILFPLVGISLFAYSYYLPAQKEIAQCKARLKQTQERLSKLKLESKKLKKLKEEIEKTHKKYIEMSYLLPRGKEIPNLLADISNLGSDCHLDFVLFEPQKENIKDFYAELPIMLKLKGQFLQIKKFLQGISNTTRIINVRQISMKKAKSVGENVVLNVDLQLVTYRFVPQTAKIKKKKRR